MTRKQKRRERRVENRKEEKEEKVDCVKERASILQTFYQKNIIENTLNFEINFIVKLYDIFEKKQLS